MALVAALLVWAVLASLTFPALAQDPTVRASSPASTGSFPKQSGGPFGKVKRPDTAKPLHLQADQLVYDSSGSRVVARGNVEIFFDNNILTADEVIYDQGADTLTAAGNVFLKEPNGNIIRADRYVFTSDFKDGFIQQLSAVAKDDTRIAAEEAQRRDGNITEFKNGKFSPCKSEGGMPPLWCVSAAKIIHDVEAATITYQDAQFEIFGVPVVYLPFFQHADPSVKRKSGFLMPGIGYSETLGYTTEVPYHFALDPSYDFLFNPVYSSTQGVLYQGTWRHRLANGEYQVKFAAIDQSCGNIREHINDTTTRLGGETEAQRLARVEERCGELDGWRGSIETKGKFSLGSWWSAGWDAIIESDDSFRRFYKLDSILLTDRVNQLFLTGLSDRNYFSAKMYHFGGLTFEDTGDAESVVHPIIDHNYVMDDVLGGELTWTSNILQFGREDIGRTGRRQDMSRASTELKWRRRLTDAAGITYTPFGEVRGDAYQLSDFVDPTRTGPPEDRLVADDTVVRGVAGGGVTVAYPWVANSPSATHMFEPIGQIIGRSATVDQRRLPNEDARSLVFDDSNLFDTNKFSGYDRVETGTRANVGVQYTFQSNSGPYARILAGQSFHLAGTNPFTSSDSSCAIRGSSGRLRYFDGVVPGYDADCKPVFNPASGLDTDRSDYVLGVYLAPTDIFRVISQSRFDETGFDLKRQDLAARLDLGLAYIQTVYAFSKSDPLLGIKESEQDILLLGGLRLSDRWTLTGGTRYDIDGEKFLSHSMALRYSDECFVLTASMAQTGYEDKERDIVPDRTFMLRFELKHIGEYKYKTDSLDFLGGDEQQDRAVQ